MRKQPQNLLKFLFRKNNFFIGKKRSGNNLKGHQWYRYIWEIYEGREMHRRYVQADTLLLICYCWRSKLDRYRYEDIHILGTCYFAFDSTLGAR